MTTMRKVPLAWESLEDAFENNAPQVHSYLQLESGEVLRLVDGTVDPDLLARIVADPDYLPVAPVSSREQYRWMEHFIQTVEDETLHEALTHSIDGKGAFRRFKDVLMAHPVDRERWFKFRTERLRDCMTSWLETHGLEAGPRPEWRVPTAEEVLPEVERRGDRVRVQHTRARRSDLERAKLHELVDKLPSRGLDTALAFLEFSLARRPMVLPDVDATDVDATVGDDATQDAANDAAIDGASPDSSSTLDDGAD